MSAPVVPFRVVARRDASDPTPLVEALLSAKYVAGTLLALTERKMAEGTNSPEASMWEELHTIVRQQVEHLDRAITLADPRTTNTAQ